MLTRDGVFLGFLTKYSNDKVFDNLEEARSHAECDLLTINLNRMTNEKLTELLKIAYRWGRDNGSNRSEKNFNDLIKTEAINQALRTHDDVGQSEQLFCAYCGSKKQLKVETDLNSDRVCKSKLCAK